jgi:hypothetical protein
MLELIPEKHSKCILIDLKKRAEFIKKYLPFPLQAKGAAKNHLHDHKDG